MEKTTFSDVLLLARAYLANPTDDNERTLYTCIAFYFSGVQPLRFQKALYLLFRLRHFLFICDNQRKAKVKFRAFAAREWVIQMTRASSIPRPGGLGTHLFQKEPLNRTKPSSTIIPFKGGVSHRKKKTLC
ncbi:MAG: hypothetical protein K9K86_10225 [Pseudomonadales bacterium]|nr:hypothetical protein [Pseudomonadales bacterium]